MNAPARVTERQFHQQVEDWLAKNATPIAGADGQFHCQRCGTQILFAYCFMSIHDLDGERCAGAGQVWKPTVPVCPQCEPAPNLSGCVHPLPENSAIARLAHISGARQRFTILLFIIFCGFVLYVLYVAFHPRL